MTELRITVPLEPPSVNNYKGHRIIMRAGGKPFLSTYVRKPGLAYYAAVAACAGGRRMRAKAYQVAVCVYQGHGSRGDADNYGKCVFDGLVKAGVIHSDAAITDVWISKRRDRANPRTEIVIRVAQGEL